MGNGRPVIPGLPATGLVPGAGGAFGGVLPPGGVGSGRALGLAADGLAPGGVGSGRLAVTFLVTFANAGLDTAFLFAAPAGPIGRGPAGAGGALGTPAGFIMGFAPAGGGGALGAPAAGPLGPPGAGGALGTLAPGFIALFLV